jgi:hypothetical protein
MKKYKTYDEFINGRVTNVDKVDYERTDGYESGQWAQEALEKREITEGDDYVLYSYESHGVVDIPEMDIVLKHGHETIIIFHRPSKTIKTIYTR